MVVEGPPVCVEGDEGAVELGELDGCGEGGEGVCYVAGFAPEVGDGGSCESQWEGVGFRDGGVVGEREEGEGD